MRHQIADLQAERLRIADRRIDAAEATYEARNRAVAQYRKAEPGVRAARRARSEARRNLAAAVAQRAALTGSRR